jgi:hypothetical protein
MAQSKHFNSRSISMTIDTISDLTNRLNRLERTNQNLRRSLLALAVGGSLVLFAGAMQPDKEADEKTVSFGTVQARKLVIRDDDGLDRLILALDSGEPAVTMFDHEGRRQIFLGIDEHWEDTAYLSVSSRLGNGNIDKQAVIAATTSQPDSPGSSQLVLYDGRPKPESTVRRQVVKLSTGLANQKPFLEISESSDKDEGGVNIELLNAKPNSDGRRVLLDTNASPAVLFGVELSRN